MTSPNAMSAQAVQSQRISIKSVDPVGGTAIGLTRYETECTIDLSYHPGAVHVIPEISSQWFVKRFGANWMLDRKLPYNTDTQLNVVNNPVPGTYQLGSSGNTPGPTNLMGSQINAMAPLRLFAGNSPLPDASTVDEGSMAYNGSAPVYSDGTDWVALGTGTYSKPSGGIPASDLASTLASLHLITPIITGYSETVNAMGTVGSTATIPALGTSGTRVTATLTSATPCTFTMPATASGIAFVLLLKQPASGTPTTATFTGVKWPTGGAPTITATVGKLDIIGFFGDGTNWYGNFVQGYTY